MREREGKTINRKTFRIYIIMDYSSILHPTAIKNLVSSWIADDIPSTFDVGGMVVGSRPGVAHLYMKQSGVVGGRPFFDAVFGSLEGCSVEWVKEEEVRRVCVGGVRRGGECRG